MDCQLCKSVSVRASFLLTLFIHMILKKQRMIALLLSSDAATPRVKKLHDFSDGNLKIRCWHIRLPPCLGGSHTWLKL